MFFYNNISQEREEEHKNETKENKKLFVLTFLSSVKIINKVLKMICSALVILVKYVRI